MAIKQAIQALIKKWHGMFQSDPVSYTITEGGVDVAGHYVSKDDVVWWKETIEMGFSFIDLGIKSGFEMRVHDDRASSLARYLRCHVPDKEKIRVP